MTLRLGIKGESLRIYAARNIRGPGGSPSVLKHIPETRETPWKRTVTSLHWQAYAISSALYLYGSQGSPGLTFSRAMALTRWEVSCP